MSNTSGILVSIILPVYNGEDYLEEAIYSCLSQTHKNLELVIVNDASTDGSLAIARKFAQSDSRVEIISNSTNKHLPASLNIGHHRAKGTFMTWISHDNFFDPTALEEMLISALESKADVVFTDFSIVDESGERIGEYCYTPGSSILLENIVRACFLYTKEVFLFNRGYDESLFEVEDYAFWLMASNHAMLRHVPKALYYYRKHSESLTAKKTLSQFRYERFYVERVKKMYLKFFESWGIKRAEDMSTTFTNLHLHQEIDVRRFLKNYGHFKRDLKEILQKFDRHIVLQDIDRRLRSNILRFPSNQTRSTIGLILRNRPRILFCYSKRKTIRIISKSLLGPGGLERLTKSR